MKPDAAGPLLETRNLTKRYPGVLALDDVSCAFHAGEIVGLVGKNGAGKSTLIKVLAGAVKPDSGEILIDGQVVSLATTQSATAHGLAFVHQELADVPNLTVAENVALGLGFPHRGPFVNWRQLRRNAQAVLDRLDADLNPRMLVSQLSVVQQRLVMIARGIAQDARVLVLDEPTAALTATEITRLHEVLRRVAADGMCVVYVTHRLDEVIDLTSRAVVMRDGRVVDDRPTEGLGQQQLVRSITGTLVEDTTSFRQEARDGSANDVPLLRVRGLTVPGVVQDIELDVWPGEVLGIAGLVGSGRTEIARALVGAQAGAEKELEVSGKPVKVRSPRAAIAAGIALLPEDRRGEGNVATMTVSQNITLATLPAHRRTRTIPMPSRRRKERRTAESFIAQLGITAAGANVPVGWLSGGNQQKVLLAKWLGTKAKVFIFDEPTAGIDVEGKESVFSSVLALADAGCGVIFISSDFSELVRVCHRVVALHDGVLAGEVTAPNLTQLALLNLCYGEPQLEEGVA